MSLTRAFAISRGLKGAISPSIVRQTNVLRPNLLSAYRGYVTEKNSKPQPDLSKSILTDDLLARAGVDPDEIKQSQETAKNSGDSSESTSGTDGNSNPEWKETARKSTHRSSAEIRREKYARFSYLFTLAALLGGTVYFARDWDNEEEAAKHPNIPPGYSPSSMYHRIKARFNGTFDYFSEPAYPDLLPPPLPVEYRRPLTLIIGLEDLLIHSEWTRDHGWRTAKRPGLDYFLGYLSQYYEIVVFSSAYQMYSEKVVQKLDPYGAYISYALFREATRYDDGKLIKDLSMMNRDIGRIIGVDTDPNAFSLQPDNAILLKPWEGTQDDKELVKLIPFLEWLAVQPPKDIRPIMETFKGKYIPEEYARRDAIARKQFEEDWKKKSNNWSLKLLGVQLSKPKMPQDFIREQAQKQYLSFQKYIKENGEKMLKEDQERQKEILGEQKLTLNKIVTEGMPKPEDIMAAQQKKEQEAAAAAATLAK